MPRLLLLLLAIFPFTATAETPHLQGNLHAARDISGAAIYNGHLLIGADEAVGKHENENVIQLLAPSGNDYRVVGDIMVFRGDNKLGNELDIEAIATAGNQIYVAGSHALVRKRVRAGDSREKNLKRLAKVSLDSSRNQIIRLTLDNAHNVLKTETISLAGIIADDPILSRFAAIPSKENGIDLEGIAIREGELFAGFRGPVLRGGFVPVMQLDFDHPETGHRLHWLNLHGLGIRDMAAVSNGFLILAGPVADIPNDYRLYYWSGHDSLDDGNSLSLLHKISPSLGGKPEAVVVEQETAQHLRILVLSDGLEGGAPQRYTIPR